MGPLPRHAFSNSINWWIKNTIPIQAIPHTCPNTEENLNEQVCEDCRITYNSHTKYIKGNNNKHGTAWSSIRKFAKLFDNATDNLEKQHHNRAQTSSTPTTRANIRATPRVHARVKRNNTPGIIPKKTPTPTANMEGGKDFFSPIEDSEGGQKSERKIKSKNERKKDRKIEKSRKN